MSYARLFLEVIDDLWNFALTPVRSLLSANTVEESAGRADQLSSLGPSLPIGSTKAGGHVGQVAYIQEDTVSCFTEPGLDSATVATMHYGEQVYLLQKQGDLVQVRCGVLGGWVLASGVTTDPQRIIPDLQPSVCYHRGNAAVQQIRRCLRGVLPSLLVSGGLTSKEFVCFRLFTCRQRVPWSQIAAVGAQPWGAHLCQVAGVDCQASPRTGAVLEYRSANDDLRYGYVTAVTPGASLRLESVGEIRAGEYSVQELSPADWHQLEPTFITFS